MDSKKLEILMTAIDLGSFSKASEVVGYTQSGLTHMVDSLERDIGLTLVRRDQNGITLTKEGEMLIPSIREFLRANAKLENQIAAITDKKRDTIRVAAYASIAMHWMPEILYRFRRVCPNIDVDLRMVDNAIEPFELLEKGRTAIAHLLLSSALSLRPSRLAFPAIGRRFVRMRCTRSCRRIIRWMGRKRFPSKRLRARNF